MGVLSDNAIIGASAAGDYDIDYSCRFNGLQGSGSDVALKRTQTTPTSTKIGTVSFWVKYGVRANNEYQGLLIGHDDTNNWDRIVYFDNFSLQIHGKNGGSTSTNLKTAALFRDPSAWYHICLAYDTTQATDSNRVKLYVNGEQVTSFATETYPALNAPIYFNDGTYLWIGSDHPYDATQNGAFQGYLAEYYFIDGTALDASSFGQTDADTNQWKAKKYGGAYGTNGFFLRFQDSAALGDDSSGNTNDFTSTNLAATDQMIDTPQNSTGGNFCTLNPLSLVAAGWTPTFAEGNLYARMYSDYDARGSMAMESGK